ncbi:hypothetical protein [Pseudonocardia acidicola]|uniref:DUF2637 domain-containing protein n=1 Tax=Pseudonocardia acidicola TaxID=2724939 RepID=A0ABX1SAP2_9PSEU|nr:hypothetical protein [Pseudonocardia acidicola]NMH97979.1 hypothetical protein [Pseudonocardia acidicola]
MSRTPKQHAAERRSADAVELVEGVEPAGRVVRAAIWLPGLAVALGAAVATAHGLYEVAVAARVPAGIARLYPLITDGLALVAYAATARLHGSAARYAWSVVVLAAGLSGLAQAAYLAGGSTVDASPVLRFGVGAWPAIAAAIVAHLLYLLATDDIQPRLAEPPADRSANAVQSEPFNRPDVQPEPRPTGPAVNAVSVQRPAEVSAAAARPALGAASAEQPGARSVGAPVRDRARAAAARHAHRHGALPTVTELEGLAGVSRGTAATVLKHLRAQPAALRLVAGTDDDSTETRTQP